MGGLSLLHKLGAASQLGAVLYVYGFADSAITVTISGVAISGCSAAAGGSYGVRSRHAAQQGPSVGGAGVKGARAGRACGVWGGRAHAAGESVREHRAGRL